jgi:hypothetical protein
VTRLVAVLPLSLTLLFGCGEADDSDPPGLGPAKLHPVPGCEHLDHRPCDISKPACRSRLLTLTACVRGNDAGDPPELPPVSTMSEAEYAAYLNDFLAEYPPPDPNHYETALVLLGLTRPGSLSQQAVVAGQVAFVGGLYRFATKDIVLVEHEEKLDATRGSILLVHELVHALQDRDVDLEAFQNEHASSMDSLTAVRSLIEGEASLHEVRYAAAAFGLDPATIDWRKRFSEAIDRGMDAALEEESVYGPAYQLFAYTWGARYAHLAFEQGGLDAVLARYASPPLTTRTLMASIDEALVDEPTGPAIPAPPAPPEWTAFTETTLGALGVYLVVESVRGRVTGTTEAALAWRGDRLFVLAPTDAATLDTAFVWHVDLASEADASAFAATLGATPMAVARVGSRVTLARSRSGAALPWAFTP